MRSRFAVLIALGFISCSDDDNNGQSPGDTHAAKITTVAIEVDYATGAEPYVGSTPRANDVWTLSQTNLEALYDGKTVTIPHTLAGMEELTDITGSDFDSKAILDIAGRHRGTQPTDTTAAFYVVWLDGYFFADGARQSQVLGVSLGNSGVVAMFKPVIASTSLLPAIRSFAEQAVFIHEVGHAAGLVNNGVAMATPHQDSEHGAHCNNDKCVMYWANEGANDVVDFVNQYATSSSLVLFDDNCLADARAAAR